MLFRKILLLSIIIAVSLITSTTVLAETGLQEVKLEVEALPFQIATIDDIFFDISKFSFGSKICIIGTAPPNSTVKILIKKIGDETFNLTKETIADQNGDWQICLKEELGPDSYVVYTTIINQIGKEIQSLESGFKIPEHEAKIKFIPSPIFLTEFFSKIKTTIQVLSQVNLFLLLLLLILIIGLIIFWRKRKRKENKTNQTNKTYGIN